MSTTTQIEENTVTHTYTVWSYDVWGNERDGFEVNDRCKVGSVDLDDDASDKDIVRAMVDQGYLKSARFGFEIEGDDGRIEITHAASGRPLFGLERND